MLFFKKNSLFDLEELSVKLIQSAEQAAQKGELPVASLVCEPSPFSREERKYRILALSSNSISKRHDPTAHSEMIALQEACRRKKNERLPGCMMLTTLEPCLMCTGALILARLESIYYLAPAQKGPGMSWLLSSLAKKKRLVNEKKKRKAVILNHYPSIFHLKEGEKEYQELLRLFFKMRRGA